METTGVALIHGIETSSEATKSACMSLRGIGFKRAIRRARSTYLLRASNREAHLTSHMRTISSFWHLTRTTHVPNPLTF